jgi:hypothetical protein
MPEVKSAASSGVWLQPRFLVSVLAVSLMLLERGGQRVWRRPRGLPEVVARLAGGARSGAKAMLWTNGIGSSRVAPSCVTVTTMRE